MSISVPIISVGLACPLGLKTMPAIAAIHAGMSPFIERDDVLVPGGEATAAALELPQLPRDSRVARCAFLLSHALSEALRPVRELSNSSIATVLIVPDGSIGPRVEPADLLDRAARARRQAGALPQLNVVRVVAGGRAAMFEALEVATATLNHGIAPLVLIAAVDSRVDTQTLAALADANRLESSSNLDGYIPGEAAACVLLGTGSTPAVPKLAEIVSLARAHEPRPLIADPTGVATAEGLSTAFRQLRLGFGGRVDEVFAAITGERYFAQEFAHAYLRNSALMPEPLRFRSIAASLGDVGAVSGVLALIHAVVRAGPPGPGNRNPTNAASLIYASDDAGAIGGCVLASSHGR